MPTILEEAGKFVDGARQDAYGHPADSFAAVGRAAKELGIDPTSSPYHHALYMVLLKVCRLVESPDHRDSVIDIAGYARTYELTLEKYGVEGSG